MHGYSVFVHITRIGLVPPDDLSETLSQPDKYLTSGHKKAVPPSGHCMKWRVLPQIFIPVNLLAQGVHGSRMLAELDDEIKSIETGT